MSFQLHQWALRYIGVGLLLVAIPHASAGERPISVPFQLIDRQYRNDVRNLVDDPTILRRLPVTVFRTERSTYQYLLDHLPLSSRLSGLLGFGRYRVTELEDGRLHGDDGRGVSGKFRAVYSDDNKRIFLGEGSFDPWFLPKVSGAVVMVVEFKELPTGASGVQGPSMATRVDVYLRTNRLVGYVLQILGETADKKLVKLISSAQRTSEKVSTDPRRVWRKMSGSGLFTPWELESFKQAIMSPTAGG